MSFNIFLSCSSLRLLPPSAGWTKCPEVGWGGHAPGFGTLCPSGGAARKTDFILPLAAGNGKSLTALYPCPGAGWCRCVGGGYLVVKVRGKLTRCGSGKLEVFSSGYISTYNLSIWLNHYFNNMSPKHIVVVVK